MHMRSSTAAVVVLAVVAFVFALLILAQLKFDPIAIDPHWTGTPLPPCFVDAKACEGHLLGTDELGRDVLARLGRGGEITLGLSLIAVLFEIAIGASFGALSRYGGRSLKYTIDRVAAALSCYPVWPFLIVIVCVATPPTRSAMPPIALAAILAILLSPQVIHIIGSADDPRNIAPAGFNQAARDFARIIAILATVDFFRFGIQPPTPTWGNMLGLMAENFQVAWWAAVFPAICLFLAVLSWRFSGVDFSEAARVRTLEQVSHDRQGHSLGRKRPHGSRRA